MGLVTGLCRARRLDLGIGILFSQAGDDEMTSAIAAIGPFWDANETWLVLRWGCCSSLFRWRMASSSPRSTCLASSPLVGLIMRAASFRFPRQGPSTEAALEPHLRFGCFIASLAQAKHAHACVLGLVR